MKRRKSKKFFYKQSIIVGFAAIYLTCMVLTTYLMKENYEDTLVTEAMDTIMDVEANIKDSDYLYYDENGELSQDFIQEIQYILSAKSYTGKYSFACAGVYGPDGGLLARTSEYFFSHSLFDDQEQTGPLIYEKKYWEKWKNDEFLQTFDLIDETTDHIEYFKPLEKWEGNTYTYAAPLRLADFETTNDKYTIQLNLRIYPWQAAMDYLKYIYLYGFVLMIVCMAKVLHSTGKAYKMQAELEETRRDFTNAIAHELKTPLAVIRGLAENLEEEESEETRNYYTYQIVNQTEIMDSMVKNMILVSRLDSEKLILKEEEVSILPILKEQMEKLEHPMGEKNLKIQYWNDADFIVRGDKSYLEKAILNLLENAVFYNKDDGMISIHVNREECVIENTADPISEEDLPYVCDMFFTGNKSRTSVMKHMGLGLYLAKKIFVLHDLDFDISNTDIGVKVRFGMKK